MGPQTPDIIFQQWREAEAAAAAAESALLDASILSASGRCPPPCQAEWDEARALRARAVELFHLATQHVRAVALRGVMGLERMQHMLPAALPPPAQHFLTAPPPGEGNDGNERS